MTRSALSPGMMNLATTPTIKPIMTVQRILIRRSSAKRSQLQFCDPAKQNRLDPDQGFNAAANSALVGHRQQNPMSGRIISGNGLV
jgi:hypothetical protein